MPDSFVLLLSVVESVMLRFPTYGLDRACRRQSLFSQTLRGLLFEEFDHPKRRGVLPRAFRPFGHLIEVRYGTLWERILSASKSYGSYRSNGRPHVVGGPLRLRDYIFRRLGRLAISYRECGNSTTAVCDGSDIALCQWIARTNGARELTGAFRADGIVDSIGN